jgi:IS5 family transposase
VVRADTAYHSHAREAARKARGVKPRRMRQANKRHPKLPPGSTARTAAVGGYHVD